MRSRILRTAVGASLATLSIVIASCSAGAGTGTMSSESAVTATPGTGGGSRIPAPSEVLRFAAPLLSGGEIDGTSLAGKDVALWFWAPW